MERKKFWLLLSIIIIIIIITILTLNFVGIPVHPFSKEICGCQHRISNHYFLIFGIIVILATIPISHYFLSIKIEKKINKHVETILRFIKKKGDISKNIHSNEKRAILKFLSPNERKVLDRLIKTKEEVLQSDITKIGGMTKLKTHRAVKSLEEKGIIKTKPHGKSKIIYLIDEIKKSLNL